jgi:hypothetical protein
MASKLVTVGGLITPLMRLLTHQGGVSCWRKSIEDACEPLKESLSGSGSRNGMFRTRRNRPRFRSGLSMRGISLPTELKQPDETTFHPRIFWVEPAISGAVAQNCAFLVLRYRFRRALSFVPQASTLNPTALNGLLLKSTWIPTMNDKASLRSK